MPERPVFKLGPAGRRAFRFALAEMERQGTWRPCFIFILSLYGTAVDRAAGCQRDVRRLGVRTLIHDYTTPSGLVRPATTVEILNDARAFVIECADSLGLTPAGRLNVSRTFHRHPAYGLPARPIGVRLRRPPKGPYAPPDRPAA